ncbi:MULTISPECIES: hypothetical protein [Aphanothece]|uniref:hypothetical protein n=1 Tax=Aphanothece TaxID=1121 RepID=UPI00398E4750
MEFTPYQAKSATPRSERRLPLRGAGLYLVSVPEISQPLKWESYYKCGSNAAKIPGGDELGTFSFVGQDSPPAVSLLVAEGTAEDQKFMRSLQAYAKSCNQAIASSEIMSLLAIDSKATIDEIPQRLSVFCD